MTIAAPSTEERGDSIPSEAQGKATNKQIEDWRKP